MAILAQGGHIGEAGRGLGLAPCFIIFEVTILPSQLRVVVALGVPTLCAGAGVAPLLSRLAVRGSLSATLPSIPDLPRRPLSFTNALRLLEGFALFGNTSPTYFT